MSRLVGIGEASKILGVSISTLRRWEQTGKLVPSRTEYNHRRYDLDQLVGAPQTMPDDQRLTIAYARVSSHDQKADLERQSKVLELFCASHGWDFQIITDLGSGINYHKKGLKRLLDLIVAGKVGRLVITHKDRLLRFGAELVFSICEIKGVEIIIINKGEDATFEEDLAKDVLEIITVFSARLYGARSRKNKKLIDDLQKVVNDAACAQD